VKRRRKIAACAVLASLAALAARSPARAEMWPRESTPDTLPVYEMKRPGYDPEGILYRSFLFSPSATEAGKYDDNIFASRRRVESDYVNTTGEELGAASQWSRHSLSGRLFAAQELYALHPGENANTFGADASGRLDITQDSFLRFDGGFIEQPQSRASIEAAVGTAERPIYDTGTSGINFYQRFNHLVERAQYHFTRIDYVTSGNESRNSITNAVNDRLSYDFSGELATFVQAGYSLRDWDLRPAERNFDSLTGLVGVTVSIPTVLEAEVGIGVLRQSYSNDQFATLVTPVFNGHVLWNVLPLTSLIASFSRDVTGTENFCNATTHTCQSGNTIVLQPGTGVRDTLETTAARFDVQHEFWHDLLGSAGFHYEQSVFNFSGLTDDTYTFSTDLRYLINRYLEANLDYTFQTRVSSRPDDSTFNSGGFTTNIVMVTLKAGF
jgi:hypothetical protein